MVRNKNKMLWKCTAKLLATLLSLMLADLLCWLLLLAVLRATAVGLLLLAGVGIEAEGGIVGGQCQLSSIITQFNNHGKQTNIPLAPVGNNKYCEQKRIRRGEKIKSLRTRKKRKRK